MLNPTPENVITLGFRPDLAKGFAMKLINGAAKVLYLELSIPRDYAAKIKSFVML